MILFDGVSIDYKNIKEEVFSILKKEIHSVKYILKEESDIYGSRGNFGVISLTSREHILKKLDHHFVHKPKRIYVLNNKVVSEHFIDSFDRNKIQDVKVINEQSKISEYTSENFDQLILISTKKNE
ncbi:hypothetical protein [uncultured Tenacibaculum sp.]|nr:hypothetical protein [uncultured Tenacibaculum sp.]